MALADLIKATPFTINKSILEKKQHLIVLLLFLSLHTFFSTFHQISKFISTLFSTIVQQHFTVCSHRRNILIIYINCYNFFTSLNVMIYLS
ncbi:MAG: hypothetical protein K0R80_2569 [Clostridia bacterium]|jgi:hypothetical protein|nr:hypothetical protein [Clostridia bacterium]